MESFMQFMMGGGPGGHAGRGFQQEYVVFSMAIFPGPSRAAADKGGQSTMA